MDFMTVGQLKAALADLPDDAPILVKPHNGEEFGAQPWRYNTRQVVNAYQANDDRYTQNQVLVIDLDEIENSP